MNYVYNIFGGFRYYYNTINTATLSGAIDVVVVEQPDGSYLSTPFHVRFGKFAVFNTEDKFVDIRINNELIEGIKMKLGDNGVAFFVEEIDDEEDLPEYLTTSPVPGASAGESDTEKKVNVKKKLPKKSEARKKNPKTSSSSKKTHKRNKSIFDPSTSTQIQPHLNPCFPYRKCCSLPDLSMFAQNEYSDDAADKKLNHLDLSSVTKSGRPIHQSRSTIISKDLEAIASLKQNNKPQKRKNKHSESESDEETKQKPEKVSTPRNINEISDGALSDSEIDRQRYDNHNNDSEWKWGEYPYSKNDKKPEAKSKDNSKAEGGSSWNWFSWRSSQAPREEGVYLGDLVNKDPNQLEKYFGTSCTSQVSNVDSGTGCSMEASPSSPSAMSMESLVDENVANQVSSPDASESVKREAPTPQEVDIAFEKADIVEKQMLAGTGKDAEAQASTFTEEVQKNLDKHADLINGQRSELPAKSRSMSGTSVISDISSIDEGAIGVYTSDGRRIRYKRTLRLKSDQLRALRLQYGSNNAKFSISTKIQGTVRCECHVYLLKWDERIVISDIDGTITKSDVLGHIIPAIGGTWAHTNIVDLYRRIQNNGYRIIYLSSRAIGQSYQTKRYLASVIQDSKTLPDGPVLLSPTSVLMAFRKEVIERRPEEFKIACLSDLMSLFPVKHPFYAGFGNRETDIKSYVAVGIPPERILIIDPSGLLRNVGHAGFSTNYDTMLKDNTVDCLFPPLGRRESLDVEAENSAFNYWRNKVHDVDNLDFERYERGNRPK